MDDGWQAAEAETPSIVEIHVGVDAEVLEAAAAKANGHGPSVVRPTVEFVPETRFLAVNGNGQNSDGEAKAADPQRTLFSWAEFMAEPPAKPKGPARNTQPSLSLFEWAVAVEQAQEAEKDEVAVPA